MIHNATQHSLRNWLVRSALTLSILALFACPDVEDGSSDDSEPGAPVYEVVFTPVASTVDGANGADVATFVPDETTSTLTIHFDRLVDKSVSDLSVAQLDEVIQDPDTADYSGNNWHKFGEFSFTKGGTPIPFWAMSSKTEQALDGFATEIYSPAEFAGAIELSDEIATGRYDMSRLWSNGTYYYSVLYLANGLVSIPAGNGNNNRAISNILCVSQLKDTNPDTSVSCYISFPQSVLNHFNDLASTLSVDRSNVYFYIYGVKNGQQFPTAAIDLATDSTGTANAAAGATVWDATESAALVASDAIEAGRFHITISLDGKD